MPSCAVWNAVNYLYFQRRHRRRRRHRCCCWCSCSISSDCASITRFFLLRFSPAQWNRMRLFYRVQNVLSIYQRWFVIPCANFGLFGRGTAKEEEERVWCHAGFFLDHPRKLMNWDIKLTGIAILKTLSMLSTKQCILTCAALAHIISICSKLTWILIKIVFKSITTNWLHRDRLENASKWLTKYISMHRLLHAFHGCDAIRRTSPFSVIATI